MFDGTSLQPSKIVYPEFFLAKGMLACRTDVVTFRETEIFKGPQVQLGVGQELTNGQRGGSRFFFHAKAKKIPPPPPPPHKK